MNDHFMAALCKSAQTLEEENLQHDRLSVCASNGLDLNKRHYLAQCVCETRLAVTNAVIYNVQSRKCTSSRHK